MSARRARGAHDDQERPAAARPAEGSPPSAPPPADPLAEGSRTSEAASAHLAAIVASSDDAIASKNLQGIVQSWNRGAERLFDYTAAEMIGRPMAILIPEDRADEEPEILARVGRGEAVDHYETVRRRKDGSLVDISLTVSPIRDAAGKVLGASKIARDISERKRAEAVQREADRRKTEFLAMLAHELRGPLAPLRYALEIVRLAPEDVASVRTAAETMSRQVGHLVRLVDDLLDLGRIERGKVELRKERVELGALARQAAETLRPLCEAKSQALTLSIGAEPIHLAADPVRLVQVFGNLLHNATKFTAAGGRIHVAVERLDDRALVFVRDNGVGIAEGELPRIFEMFAQADTSLDRPHSGLGLGLALARDLVEMHGGSLEARSPGPGKGSEFVVTLPLGATALARARPARAAIAETATRRRVLVVDDNRDTAAMLAKQLELSGHETRVAHDGAKALRLAATFLPDTAILDIGLPGLDGYELARRIRAEPWGRGMVLVAVTGWGQPEDLRLSREAGFDDHLVKPISSAALKRWLERPS